MVDLITEAEYLYAVHGVSVRANRRLHGLPQLACQREPELQIWLGPLDALKLRRPELNWRDLDLSPEGHTASALWRQPAMQGDLFFWRVCDQRQLQLAILTDAGDSIEIGWHGPPDVAEDALERAAATYFLMNLLGMALRLSGRFVLHGNAVGAGGRAIVWLGHKGAGKSTLAAAFVAAGYSLLTDDQIVLWPTDAGFGVAPGVRRLRLWPESMAALAPTDADYRLHQPFGDDTKGYVAVDAADDLRDVLAPTPVHAIYVLQPRRADLAQPLVETPTMGTQLHLLLTHCLGRKSMPLRDAQQRAEFQAAVELVQRVPVRLLHLPDTLDRLPEVVRTLVSGVTPG